MMLTLRVSASDLDAYRRYRGDEEAELSDLLAQLRRESPPTEAMLAGTALHKALEVADPGAEFAEMEADGFHFTIGFDAEVDLPPIRERKETRDYRIDGVRVTLVGMVDAIHGKRVDDHKFTSRFDPERFLNSMQWRVYLEVFGADEFRWNVFEGRETGPVDQSDHYSAKGYHIHTLHKLTMHRYPGMERDVEHELRLFLDFARVHLPERLVEREPEPWEHLGAG